MKTMYQATAKGRALGAMALIMASAMFTACSNNDEPRPATGVTENNDGTYTYVIGADVEQTRLTYADSDASTPDANDPNSNVSCAWSGGETIVISDGANSYNFKVDDAGASSTLSYSGSQIRNSTNFTGTAKYTPTGSQVQTSNGSLNHMNSADYLEATLSGFDFNTGGAITFRHAKTCVIRIKLTAPEAIISGATMTLSGPWTSPQVLNLGWSAASGTDLTLYIMAATTTINSGATLAFTLKQPDGEGNTNGDKFIWTYNAPNTVTWEAGRYYFTTLGGTPAVELGPNHTTNVDIAASSYGNGVSVSW